MNKKKRYNELSDELIEKIKDYYNEGNSCQKTAYNFNVGKTTVRSYVEIRKNEKITDSERKKRAIEAVQKRRHKIKNMAVEYKGGKCVICGYNKCNRSLTFHHLDPNKKDFSISYEGHSRSWEKVKKELDKCVLVCSNCHGEIHEDINKHC